ncbi:hypothetical protein [Aneurinibacillus aneurinilyticus]|nr:hypothetical protein [Aneurinibacillus aneurinilyticus]
MLPKQEQRAANFQGKAHRKTLRKLRNRRIPDGTYGGVGGWLFN